MPLTCCSIGVYIVSSTNSGVVSSGSVERAAASGSWLEGDGQGLHNPLAWDSIPSSLQEKFPHWKDKSPLKPQGQGADSQGEFESTGTVLVESIRNQFFIVIYTKSYCVVST